MKNDSIHHFTAKNVLDLRMLPTNNKRHESFNHESRRTIEFSVDDLFNHESRRTIEFIMFTGQQRNTSPACYPPIINDMHLIKRKDLIPLSKFRFKTTRISSHGFHDSNELATQMHIHEGKTKAKNILQSTMKDIIKIKVHLATDPTPRRKW